MKVAMTAPSLRIFTRPVRHHAIADAQAQHAQASLGAQARLALSSAMAAPAARAGAQMGMGWGLRLMLPPLLSVMALTVQLPQTWPAPGS